MDSHHALKASLFQIESPRVLVIGDLMLDRYTWGEVMRISPEAPIPILRVLSEENRLGGAASAMANLAALGSKVFACGVVGSDPNSNILIELLRKQCIDTSGVFQENTYPTILKQRMLAGHHHLLRTDFDPPEGHPIACRSQLQKFIETSLSQMDAVVLSDYGKGLLTSEFLRWIQESAQKHGCPVIVDPRRNAFYPDYHGTTLIKPNRTEAAEVVGYPLKDQASQLAAATEIQRITQASYVVVSLDREGLLLFSNMQNYHFFPATALEVYDVVGAGDMLIAVLAFFIAGKGAIEHAVFWANLAASMEIQHVGVVSFSKEDLLQNLEVGHVSKKIVTLSQLQSHLKRQPRPLVFTNGYFDKLSSGHIKFLQQLQQFEGVKVVAINSDQSIETSKGSPPFSMNGNGLNCWPPSKELIGFLFLTKKTLDLF